VNGKIQVNKVSLEVNVGADDANSPKVRIGVESGRRGRKKKERSEKWQPEETEKFYRALQIFGTDFSFIADLLSGRTRKQIKVKRI